MSSLIARARARRGRALLAAAVVAATAVGGSVALASDGGFGLPRAVDPAQVELFVGVTPTRVLDTRVPSPNPFGPGETRVVSLAGRVDPRVTSVAINLTIDGDATSQSFLTVWPTGQARPNASANNAQPGQVTPNQMVAKLGADQSFSVFNERGQVNVVIDVVGVYVPLDEVDVGSVAAEGSRFLSGNGAPAANLGSVDDMYFDKTNKAFYGPKTASGWGSPVSVQGQPGAAGAQGPQGPQGPQGAQGPEGEQGPAGAAGATGAAGPAGAVSGVVAGGTAGGPPLAVLPNADTPFTSVATFTAPAEGTYMLRADVTISFASTTPLSVALGATVTCRWADGNDIRMSAGLTAGISVPLLLDVAGINQNYLGVPGFVENAAEDATVDLECSVDQTLTVGQQINVQTAITAIQVTQIS